MNHQSSNNPVQKQKHTAVRLYPVKISNKNSFRKAYYKLILY